MENNNDGKVYIYDIETIANVFTYYAINRDTKEHVFFIIGADVNHTVELLDHLDSIRGHIGFNNINFDYPVLHHFMGARSKFIGMEGEQVARELFRKAQEIVKEEYSEVKKPFIQQLDLFRVQHFNNKARMTSLKKLEINLNFDNVQDMPHHWESDVTDFGQVIDILEYNKNDVEATAMFYEKTLPKIELRRGIRKKYGLECLNYPDSKIGEELTLKLYCEATGKSSSVVRKQRTRRKSFKFKECLPSYVKFSTDTFNDLLEYLEGIEVKELKQSFEYSVNYGGFQFDLGTGGIHGCIKAGVYDEDDKFMIKDSDVASLYPSLAIANDIYPAHLGEEFLTVYRDGIVLPRLEAKKNGDKVMADGFKLSANSVYGKSNSEYSFLFDGLYTLKTTLAGQVSLCMLSEMLMSQIPEFTMLQVNTDGITSRFPRQYDELYDKICKEWEDITKLSLEHAYYSKMVIRDVNNYIAQTTEGKVKRKGAFKRNEDMDADGEYHKSFSMGVVPIALSEFFINNVPVEETVRNTTDIYLFCKTANTIGSWKAESYELNEEGEEVDIRPEQKNIRYYLSNHGRYLRKVNQKDGRRIGVDTEKTVTVFNKFEKRVFEDYDVDEQYYIDEVYKIIHLIDGTTEREEEERRLAREQAKRDREEERFVQYCIDKVPTDKQLEAHRRDWLIEKYGLPLTRTQIKK